MLGIMNARERAFSSFREQKNNAPRHSSLHKCWQSVYATVDLPVLAMPPSQKMGRLSSHAHCFEPVHQFYMSATHAGPPHQPSCCCVRVKECLRSKGQKNRGLGLASQQPNKYESSSAYQSSFCTVFLTRCPPVGGWAVKVCCHC